MTTETVEATEPTIDYNASRYGDLKYNGTIYRLEESAQWGTGEGRHYYFADAKSDDGDRVRVIWFIGDDDQEFDEETGSWKFSEHVGDDPDEYFHRWHDWNDFTVTIV